MSDSGCKGGVDADCGSEGELGGCGVGSEAIVEDLKAFVSCLKFWVSWKYEK